MRFWETALVQRWLWRPIITTPRLASCYLLHAEKPYYLEKHTGWLFENIKQCSQQNQTRYRVVYLWREVYESFRHHTLTIKVLHYWIKVDLKITVINYSFSCFSKPVSCCLSVEHTFYSLIIFPEVIQIQSHIQKLHKVYIIIKWSVSVT